MVAAAARLSVAVLAATLLNAAPALAGAARDVCPPATPGHAACLAQVITGAPGTAALTALPAGYVQLTQLVNQPLTLGQLSSVPIAL